MNTQEAYEYMRVYLTREGARQAIDKAGDCMYEGRIEGAIHRCAVGCLLTPESLNERMQSGSQCGDERTVTLRDYLGSVVGVLKHFSVPELRDIDRNFLDEAQKLHDERENWKGGKFNVALLNDLAHDHGLKVMMDELVEVEPEQVLTLA